MQDAFRHQDKARVPLVWQHGHSDPENVLGHAILEAKEEGVYTYAFFNASPKAQQARILVEHGDINMLSIWANQLIQRGSNVLHGAIREVSLVLSGANPGAFIDNVTIRHADDIETILDDEAIIFTGFEIIHSDESPEIGDENSENEENDNEGDSAEDSSVQEVYDSLNDAQKEMVHSMLSSALGELNHEDSTDGEETIQDVYDSMTEKQQQVLHFMLGEAIKNAELAQSDINLNTNQEGQEGPTMKHNVFESQGTQSNKTVISHDDMKNIVATASRTGSLKHAVQEYALSHGIDDIDVLFPDAQAISNVPEWISRRTEWVGNFLGAVRKSPFSRIKTLSADLTFEQARAKGYVKGTMKKEEFFGVASRSTTPTTIYKKQALDRDDVLDITDFDVVAWLKAEMRLMLDEEIARACLIGDGRDISHEDKINEGNIRPIASDNELYTTQLNVNVDDANSSMTEVLDAVILNRHKLKGTGQPTFYTTEYWIARFLLLRDGNGLRIYKTLQDLAAELRVSSIVAVEAMMDDPDLIGVMVNPVDYVLGADRGGEVSMFDDFDIDYNKQKYLIETRLSGALVKVKSAMTIRRTAGINVLVAPNTPTFDTETGVLTIVNQTGVVYKNGNTVVNAAGSPYAAIAPGASVTITATPASGYYFATSDDDSWTFTRDA
jgi:hypothetical protein